MSNINKPNSHKFEDIFVKPLKPKLKPIPKKTSAYDRLKEEVYATGNKWAIENFHATHD